VLIQTSAPQQQSGVTAQHVQQQWSHSAPPEPSPSTPVNPPGLQYTNRREQLGSLVLPKNGSNTSLNNYGGNLSNNATCQCGTGAKSNNGSDSTSQQLNQAARYKLSQGSVPRTYTSAEMRIESEHTSDMNDIRLNTPNRRVSSASSTRLRSNTKTPTKISVPAPPNPRAYPIQALTM